MEECLYVWEGVLDKYGEIGLHIIMFLSPGVATITTPSHTTPHHTTPHHTTPHHATPHHTTPHHATTHHSQAPSLQSTFVSRPNLCGVRTPKNKNLSTFSQCCQPSVDCSLFWVFSLCLCSLFYFVFFVLFCVLCFILCFLFHSVFFAYFPNLAFHK